MRLKKNKIFNLFAILSGILLFGSIENAYSTDNYEKYDDIIKETHAKSLILREKAMRNYISRDPSGKIFPPPKWKGVSWELVAFHLNEKTDIANKRLLEAATQTVAKIKSGDFGNAKQANGKIIYRPEGTDQRPFNFFNGPEYTEIIYKYGSEGLIEKGRLKKETESAMKEFMWLVISQESRLVEAKMDRLLTYQGTENHDILRRPIFFLWNYLFMKDSRYKHRNYNDGGTAKKHYEAYREYFLKRPGARMVAGHWAEAGSDVYQKYTPTMILTMASIAPDEKIRTLYKQMLDMIFITEAQISIKGRRCAGKTRAANWGRNSFEKTKNILYGIDILDQHPCGSSHSKVFEVNKYQLPSSAIALRKIEFPAETAYEVVNRCLAEEKQNSVNSFNGEAVTYNPDGRNINYGYRTPHYLIGGMMFDMSISKNRDGVICPSYSAITLQNRWSGIVYDHPETSLPLTKENISAIFPIIMKANDKKGRPQNSIWGVYHKNVMIVQRIPPVKDCRMGSYNTGKIFMAIYGSRLSVIEHKGWIFVSDGNAYSALKFIDDDYVWDDKKEKITCANYDINNNPRVLLHAGDKGTHGSMEDFQDMISNNHLEVSSDKFYYHCDKDNISLRVCSYNPRSYKKWTLPIINGKKLDLRPKWTYKSPYVKSKYNSKKATVTVGPITEVYDFNVN